MIPEKNAPPSAGGKPTRGLSDETKPNVELNITQKAQKSKLAEKEGIAYFVIDKMSSYIADRTKPETAADLTRVELEAIYKGIHLSENAAGETQLTPPPEALNINEAMAKCDFVLAEILKACAQPQTQKEEIPAPAPAELPQRKTSKYEGIAALAEYTKRGIRLMPCVPVEDDPKRYRPIAGKDRRDNTATADINVIKKYMAGALWPHVPIELFRMNPSEANLCCLDIDMNHSDGADGEANFYRLLRARGYDPLPPILRNLRNFPVRVETPNGGLHPCFSHNGQTIKKTKLAEGVEVFHVDPLTAAGSRKENGAYIL